MAFPANINLANLDGTNGFRLFGVWGGIELGTSVASAGDVNGDGFDDVIVSAPLYLQIRGYVGASYVVFGKAAGFDASISLYDLDGTTGFKMSRAAEDSGTGAYGDLSVASAGDVNGDGFDDLIIGASYANFPSDPDFYGTGAAYVVYGKSAGFAENIDLSSLDGTTGFRLVGTRVGDRAGLSVASAGDVNGDGLDDMIIGAPRARLAGVNTTFGASYVVFGKVEGFASTIDLAALDGTTGFKLIGEATLDMAGYSVASAGDVNGDGFADLIVGASSADPNGSSSGASYVVFGKASGFTANLDLSSLNGGNGFRMVGAAAGHESGRAVASAGDVNGDGYDDIIIGSARDWSYVVFGQASGFAANLDLADLDGTTGFRLVGGAGSDSGWSVASAGDVNGDGFADLIVGVRDVDHNGIGSNVSYVLFGKASGFAPTIDLVSLDGTSGFKFSGDAGFGSATSVASAGDVNGDGFDDLIVGLPSADTWRGESYVVFGGAFGATVATTGTAAAEMLIGGAGDDVLTGGGGGDVFHAGAGDDRLVVADLSFRLADGGNGTDTLALSGAGFLLDLSDPVMAGRLDGIERIDLRGSGNNALQINAAAVLGGGGAVTGGRHVLTVLGNAGDSFEFAESGWTKTGSFEQDSILFDRWERGNAVVDIQQGFDQPGVIAGSPGPDWLIGGPGYDVLNGGAGDDTLDGRLGADTMEGGLGNDTYHVDNVGDVLIDAPGEGKDRVFTRVDFTLAAGQAIENLRASVGAMGLVLTGNALANTITGGVGDDTLNGGAGDDTLRGGLGADLMTGGTGDDIYGVDDVGDAVVELADEGIDTVNTILSSYDLGANVENVQFLGTGNFTGTGNELANILTGGAGDDTMDGGAGNDVLRGGLGADVMTGGTGNDTYGVDDVGDVVVELAGGGTDLVNTILSSYTLGANVEHLTFVGTGNFSGTGNELANSLTGGTGDDTLDGGRGKDTLSGGKGNDVLIGGWGADKLTGGAGADSFVFRDARDSTHVSRDTILDFTVGQDRIDFTEMLSGGNFHALQTVTSIPVTIDAHSLVALVGANGNTVLYVNDTGAAQATNNASMEILLKGVTTLGITDLDYHLL